MRPFESRCSFLPPPTILSHRWKKYSPKTRQTCCPASPQSFFSIYRTTPFSARGFFRIGGGTEKRLEESVIMGFFTLLQSPVVEKINFIPFIETRNIVIASMRRLCRGKSKCFLVAIIRLIELQLLFFIRAAVLFSAIDFLQIYCWYMSSRCTYNVVGTISKFFSKYSMEISICLLLCRLMMYELFNLRSVLNRYTLNK